MIDVLVAGSPFPGLRHFDSSEGHLFFGREQQIDELLRRLRLKRFIAVVGTSGSGKSSLVRAGLLPALRVGAMSHAGSRWRIVTVRPGNDPLGALALELEREGLLGDDGDPQLRADLAQAVLDRGGLGLVEVIRQARLMPSENVLVVVDQFEELFRYSQLDGDAAAAFVKLLLNASAHPDVPLYVVLTMRSDFLGECAVFTDLPERINDGLYLVPRMRRDQLERAIVGPVRVAEERITPRLVNQLLNDVGDAPDQLPVLQHALAYAWDLWKGARAPGEPLDLVHFERTGGLKRALECHAESIYGALPIEMQDVARRLFCTITELGGDDRAIRRPTELALLRAITRAPDEELRWVIEAFRAPGRSFLTPPFGAELHDRRVIDISHESLTRIWSRLGEWLQDEAASAQTYRRLAQDAALHAEGHAALWTDPGLAFAEQWRASAQPNAEWSERYVANAARAFPEAMAFLDAGIAAREREREADERRREAAEAAERQELERRAEVQRTRADAARAVAARTRIAAFGMSAIAVVAIVLAGIAVQLAAVSQRALVAKNSAVAAATRNANSLLVSAAGFRDRGVPVDVTRNVLEQTQTLEQNLIGIGEQSLELRRSQQATLTAVASTLISMGDPETALAAATRSRAIAEELVAAYPANTDFQGDLAAAERMQGAAYFVRDRSADAKRSYDASLAIAERLAAADPRNPAWQQGVADSLQGVGRVLLAQRKRPDAMRDFRRSITILDTRDASRGENVAWQRDLGRAYLGAGDVSRASGNRADAMSYYRKELRVAQRLVGKDASNARWQRDFAIALSRIGTLLIGTNKRAGLTYYRASLAINERLARADARNAYLQRYLAADLKNLADNGDDPRARYDRALTIMQRLGVLGMLTDADRKLIRDLERRRAELRRSREHVLRYAGTVATSASSASYSRFPLVSTSASARP